MNQKLHEIKKKLGLRELSVIQLLQGHAAIINELRERKVLRSSNNPIADYSEWLVAKVLDLDLRGNSSSGYDAMDKDGSRIQIKSRRVTPKNKSVRLSAIRNLLEWPFDEIIGVIYKEDYEIDYVARVPYSVVLEKSSFNEHTNSHIFYLRRSLFKNPMIIDLTRLFIDS